MPVLVGLVVLAILVVYSRRRKDPALQLVLFKKKEFSVGVLIFRFQGVARGSYFAGLANLGVDAERIDKSVKVLSAWRKQNSGDVAAQFGTTARQLGVVIDHDEGAYAHGVTFVLNAKKR